MMWVYICSEPQCFTVGFYESNGTWNPDSDWPTSEQAGKRCHYLNGSKEDPSESTSECVKKVAELRQQVAELEQRAMDACDGATLADSERINVERKLAQVTQEQDSWHTDASSHLQALCEKQAEVNGLEQQLAERDATIQRLREALVSLAQQIINKEVV